MHVEPVGGLKETGNPWQNWTCWFNRLFEKLSDPLITDYGEFSKYISQWVKEQEAILWVSYTNTEVKTKKTWMLMYMVKLGKCIQVGYQQLEAPGLIMDQPPKKNERVLTVQLA